MCYTQYVKLSQLSPNHTLENIQKLLNTNVSDLGRNGAVQTAGNLIGACDSQLIQDLLSGDDSDGDGKLIKYLLIHNLLIILHIYIYYYI